MKQIRRKTFTQFLLLLLSVVVGLSGCAVKSQDISPSISGEETMPRKSGGGNHGLFQ